VELSAGYSVDLETAPPGSKTPDGTPYTHVQKNIVINHLSVVGRARAEGARARVDAKPRKEAVAMSATITIEGVEYDVDPAVARQFTALEADRDSRRSVQRADADFRRSVRARSSLERTAEAVGLGQCDSMSDREVKVAIIERLSGSRIP